MAVIVNSQTKNHPINKPVTTQTDYSCLTTDTKPTDCENGSTITVLNATVSPKAVDSIWFFHAGEWYKF